MSSGGSQKTLYKHIFIEASETQAAAEFIRRFDQYPDDVACGCCGENFAVHEYDSIEAATRYHRTASMGLYGRPELSVEEFCALEDVLYVPTDQIGKD
jgi:hypothetical protein